MTKRKTILLSAIAVLLCVYILQLATAGRGSVKELRLANEPDTVVIENGKSAVTLSRQNADWVVAENKYPTDPRIAESIVKAVSDVKILDTVGKTSGGLERYDLSAEKAITVKALKDGKELRALTVGKDASTASQSYVTVDGGANVYLVSGSLRRTFGKSVEDIRTKEVYRMKYDDMTKVSVRSADGEWTFEKRGDPPSWALASGTAPAAQVDAEKAAAWVKSLASLDAKTWLADSAEPPKTGSTTVTIAAAGKDISVTVYPVGSGKDEKYLGVSSETPYVFEISPYQAEKIQKKLSDLKK